MVHDPELGASMRDRVTDGPRARIAKLEAKLAEAREIEDGLQDINRQATEEVVRLEEENAKLREALEDIAKANEMHVAVSIMDSCGDTRRFRDTANRARKALEESDQ